MIIVDSEDYFELKEEKMWHLCQIDGGLTKRSAISNSTLKTTDLGGPFLLKMFRDVFDCISQINRAEGIYIMYKFRGKWLWWRRKRNE